MGQGGSSTNGRRGPRMSIRLSRRHSKLNKSSLSYTFSLPTTDELPELLNINTASEEQLMTLPGITRQTAKAIVEHRQLIGRFRRVEDLALVSGIGADKLTALRGEICVSRKSGSHSSSCTQSLDSVRLNGDSPKVNVNTATVFQLQCLPGLNQELAGNIFCYRLKKGNFKSLDDLIKVRGIDVIRLSSIKQHLSLETTKNDQNINPIKNGRLANGYLHDSRLRNNIANNLSSLPRTPGHRKSSSMPIKHAMAMVNGFATTPINDMFDLLSAYSHRPIIHEEFSYERDGVKCCRIGTWNLDELSLEKINNPGVREVVCRTILENKISLLAIQDIVCETALQVLCDELNSPMLRRVREWKNNSRRWQYCFSTRLTCNRLGILYNTSHDDLAIEHIGRAGSDLENSPDEDQLEDKTCLRRGEESCQAVCESFSICGQKVSIVNVQAHKSLDEEDRAKLDALWQPAGLPVVVLGDFHSNENVVGLQSSYASLSSDDIHTTLELSGAGRSDILHPRDATSPLNGTWGIVRVGLTHLAIPRGWCWGGPASRYCPLWAEYSILD